MAYADERTLEYTPAWALATVSAVFIVISLIVERSLHSLGHYLHRTKRKSLNLALQKLKDELMLMGFISLTIAIFTTPMSNLCVKSSLYNKWTPCDVSSRPESGPSKTCKEGYEPFVTYKTLSQLHIFIFILAGVHVVYICLTTLLALVKVYTWRKWENETREGVLPNSSEGFTDDVNFSRQSTFVRYHASKPLGMKFLVWVVCFFKQFHVPRADYLTLRLSFVTTHNLQENYNFHSYMIRCMEDEFETIVGISIWQWGFVIIYLLFSVLEPYAHLWVALVPLVAVLIIGMKLEHVIATLALEHTGVSGPFVGVLLKPRDQLFWFNRPKFLLHAIHFILFESAFEMALFIWHVWQFNYKTCLLDDDKVSLYLRLSMGIATQMLCSFVTFPLYTLVSQMSSMPKKAFVPKNVERGLRRWHEDAQHRIKTKVQENYHMERLAKRREGTITPLDERYFLQTENNDIVFAITDGRHGERSTPMTLIMEEGTSLPDPRLPGTNNRNNMAAMDGGGPQNQNQAATFVRGGERGQQSHGQQSHGHDAVRRRTSPRVEMNLHIPAFQTEAVASTPKLLPMKRSASTTH